MKTFLNSLGKVLVVGLGYRTGLHVCNHLAGNGIDTTVSDSKTGAELASTIEKLDKRVRVLAGKQDTSILDENYDMVVLSPGVPARIPLVMAAGQRGIPVISEIELAFRLATGGIIAITGTDGKSTTTSLTGHILSSMGYDARVGGNIGIPFISFVDELSESSISILELSSYQLETIDTFRPDACAIMNITPDHLDRYDGMDLYADAKFRIAMNQSDRDTLVYRSGDPLIAARLGRVRSRLLSFSPATDSSSAFLEDGVICLRREGRIVPALDTRSMRIFGVHNAENAMAAILMVTSYLEKKGLPVDMEAIAAACRTFPGLPHRMEILGTCRGRRVINDSKATTVGAVEMAIRSLEGRGILILGGRTKGDDYSRLLKSFGDKIKGLVLVGESTDSFAGIFASMNPRAARDMGDALRISMELSDRGDTILLSPACASFDMFKSFEERGEVFRAEFMKLKETE